MSATLPYAFIDIDGVLHGTHMRYGHEQDTFIVEHIPRELVHPSLIPKPQSVDTTQWVQPRLRPGPTVTFRSQVRSSPALRADLAALPVQPVMLTSWLECNSIEAYFEQTPGPDFPGRLNLNFPGRDPDGWLPWSWKYDELRRQLDTDPRPFIWLDDDEVPKYGEQIEKDYPELPKLLVGPTYSIGLTQHHMTRIRDFLATL